MNLQKRIPALLSGILLLFCMSAVSGYADEYQNMRDEVVMLVNEQRTANGQTPLYESEFLNHAAQIRAEEIKVTFSHTRPDGRKGYSIMEELGGSYWYVGENIAYGYPTESSVMEAWMDSSGHRANILNENYHAVGIGVFESEHTYYWVQLFTDGEGLSPIYTSGNLNIDNACNSEDAALILTEAANAGAGENSILNRMQKSFADINRDSKVDSSDAAMVLQYAAYAGSGGTESVENYFKLS